MWGTLIVSGALHGFIFLPVLLSFQGGQGFSIETTDEDWAVAAIESRYEADRTRPFLEEEEESEEDLE
jgi:Niemann-Pick C1 protein